MDLGTDLSSGGGLESKPIGYDEGIQIEEIEIRDEDVARTGTLQESEFFNLQDIEEQAIKELDDFLGGGGLEDESLNLSGLEDEEDLGGLSFGEEDADEGPALMFDTEEEASFPDTSSPPADEGTLDFSLEEDMPSPEQEPEQMFSLDENFEEESLVFDAESSETPEDLAQPEFLPEEEELSGFTLEEDEGLTFGQEPEESSAKGDIEHLDISDSDLDFSLEGEDQDEELPAFSLEETETEDAASLPIDEKELSSFDLDETVGETGSEELESLNFGDAEMEDWSAESFPQPGTEGTGQFDFNITDSVRFEMQVGDDMSAPTSFEQQLDQLSEEAFTTDKETPEEEFEPDISAEAPEEEEFQTISDEWTRLMVLAKFFYRRGETYRAQHTAGENVLAVLMYYSAVETALKAVASKYETCNPAIAAFHLMLESVEEETGKQVAGAKSLMNNIVMMKNKIQLQSRYPDNEECELAARICERFLSTLADDFLTIDFAKLSPILASPEGE